MDHHVTAAGLSASEIDILWSARRAGTFLIVPRGNCPETIAVLTLGGYLREHLGHVMLTPKGHEQRRLSGRLAA